MEDGKEKFLFGYALSVRGLALCGIPVTPDMTALELLEESRSVFSGKAYDVATQCSNVLRFGRVPVPPETKQLQESLNEIRSCKKAK